MGVAYYLAFEHEIPGYDPTLAVCGKPIARAVEQLDEICTRLGVVPLLHFYSESTEEAFALLGEPVPPDRDDYPISWSEPEVGLCTVETLIEYLRINIDELPETPRIQEDLEDFRRVLLKAQEHKTRFRMRIDI